jgi:hypothetical protein
VRVKEATMTVPAIRSVRLVFAALLVLHVALSLHGPGRVAAQDYSGWYGPFDDGCYYYWDGYQYTGDVDCGSSGGGSEAGWYDYYGDGCLYYWDGYQWTGDYDCSSQVSAYAGWYDGDDGCQYYWDGYEYTDVVCESTVSYEGWYGPFDDGCYYWWDGYQYTGDYDCSESSTSYAAGWYGPMDDGCYYWWDGAQYTGDYDCSSAPANTYAAGWYGPMDDGCYYWWDGYDYSGDYDCSAAGGATVETTAGPEGWYGPYSDGCYYWWDGYSWTGDSDCGDSTYAFADAGWYGPYADSCYYWWDGTQFTGDWQCPSGYTVAAGIYGPYQDGCFYSFDGANWSVYYCPSGNYAGAGSVSVISTHDALYGMGGTVGGTDQGWSYPPGYVPLDPTYGGTTNPDAQTAFGLLLAGLTGPDSTSCTANRNGRLEFENGQLICRTP